jgi:phosphoribosylformylglycinamidine synthase
MPHEILIGNSCYTPSEAQVLIDRVNKKSSAKVKQIRGQWLYYIDLKTSNKDNLDQVKQLLQVADLHTISPSEHTGDDNLVDIYITPRYISPWSSKATNIAHVCGLKDYVRRIERGRLITIRFKQLYKGEKDLSFRYILHDRMTETFGFEQPRLDRMFDEGFPSPLLVVDIFVDERGPLNALQEYDQKMGLSLDQSEMQYLVEVFTKLGRAPHDVELFMFAQVNSE